MSCRQIGASVAGIRQVIMPILSRAGGRCVSMRHFLHSRHSSLNVEGPSEGVGNRRILAFIRERQTHAVNMRLPKRATVECAWSPRAMWSPASQDVVVHVVEIAPPPPSERQLSPSERSLRLTLSRLVVHAHRPGTLLDGRPPHPNTVPDDAVAKELAPNTTHATRRGPSL